MYFFDSSVQIVKYGHMEDILIGQKYVFSQKVLFFFKVYKICKSIYHQNSLHSNTKLAVNATAMFLILSHFQLIAGIARNSRVLVSVKSW